MSKQLHKLVVRAIEAAAMSETEIAEHLGIHKVSLSRIKRGDRGVRPELAQELADLLKEHAEELAALAEKLAEKAEEEQAHG